MPNLPSSDEQLLFPTLFPPLLPPPLLCPLLPEAEEEAEESQLVFIREEGETPWPPTLEKYCVTAWLPIDGRTVGRFKERDAVRKNL